MNALLIAAGQGPVSPGCEEAGAAKAVAGRTATKPRSRFADSPAWANLRKEPPDGPAEPAMESPPTSTSKQPANDETGRPLEAAVKKASDTTTDPTGETGAASLVSVRLASGASGADAAGTKQVQADAAGLLLEEAVPPDASITQVVAERGHVPHLQRLHLLQTGSKAGRLLVQSGSQKSGAMHLDTPVPSGEGTAGLVKGGGLEATADGIAGTNALAGVKGASSSKALVETTAELNVTQETSKAGMEPAAAEQQPTTGQKVTAKGNAVATIGQADSEDKGSRPLERQAGERAAAASQGNSVARAVKAVGKDAMSSAGSENAGGHPPPSGKQSTGEPLATAESPEGKPLATSAGGGRSELPTGASDRFERAWQEAQKGQGGSVVRQQTDSTSGLPDAVTTSSKQAFSDGAHQGAQDRPESAAPPHEPVSVVSKAATSDAGLLTRPAPKGPAQNVSEQILDSMHASIVRGDKQLLVRLQPPELGSVLIRFRQQGNEVGGVVQVGRADTRQEVEQALPQVLRGLQEAGVQIKRLDVIAYEQPERDSGRGAAPQDGSMHQPNQGHGSGETRDDPSTAWRGRWAERYQEGLDPSEAGTGGEPPPTVPQGRIDMLL